MYICTDVFWVYLFLLYSYDQFWNDSALLLLSATSQQHLQLFHTHTTVRRCKTVLVQQSQKGVDVWVQQTLMMFTGWPHLCFNEPAPRGAQWRQLAGSQCPGPRLFSRVGGLDSSWWQIQCLYMHLSNQITVDFLKWADLLNVTETRHLIPSGGFFLKTDDFLAM